MTTSTPQPSKIDQVKGSVTQALTSLSVKGSAWEILFKEHNVSAKVASYVKAIGDFSKLLQSGTPTSNPSTSADALSKATEHLQDTCSKGINSRLNTKVASAVSIARNALAAKGATLEDVLALNDKQRIAYVAALPEGDRKAIVNAVTELKRAVADAKSFIKATEQAVSGLFEKISQIKDLTDSAKEQIVTKFTSAIASLFTGSKNTDVFVQKVADTTTKVLADVEIDRKVDLAPKLLGKITDNLNKLTASLPQLGLDAKGSIVIDAAVGQEMKKFIEAKVGTAKTNLENALRATTQDKKEIARLYSELDKGFTDAMKVLKATEDTLKPLSKLTGGPRRTPNYHGKVDEIADAYDSAHYDFENPIHHRADKFREVAHVAITKLLAVPDITAEEVGKALEPLKTSTAKFLEVAEAQVELLKNHADLSKFYDDLNRRTLTVARHLGKALETASNKMIAARRAPPTPGTPSNVPTVF